MTRNLPTAFCAICIRDIFGEPRLEPLGKNDAMVAVCVRCATDGIAASLDPPERPRGRPRLTPLERSRRAGRAAKQQRELYEQRLIDRVCARARKHGPATHGRLCEACDRQASERKRRAA